MSNDFDLWLKLFLGNKKITNLDDKDLDLIKNKLSESLSSAKSKPKNQQELFEPPANPANLYMLEDGQLKQLALTASNDCKNPIAVDIRNWGNPSYAYTKFQHQIASDSLGTFQVLKVQETGYFQVYSGMVPGSDQNPTRIDRTNCFTQNNSLGIVTVFDPQNYMKIVQTVTTEIPRTNYINETSPTVTGLGYQQGSVAQGTRWADVFSANLTFSNNNGISFGLNGLTHQSAGTYPNPIHVMSASYTVGRSN